MKKITLLLSIFFTSLMGSAQFSENFDAGTTMPDGWSVINLGDANTWTFTSSIVGGAHSGTNAASIVYSATAHDDYLITSQIAVTAAVTDHFSFWIKSRSSSFLEPYEVLLSTTDAAAESFTTVLQASQTAPATWTKKEFNLSDYVGQSIYIAIRATGTDEFALYVDDVVNDAFPTALPDCTSVTVTPNAECGNFVTQFAWTSVSEANGYKLYLGTAPGTYDIANGTDVGAALAYSFTGNAATTYYYKVVPYNIVGDADCTEDNFMTAADSCYCTSSPVSNDGLGITNVSFGSLSFPNGDVTYFDHTGEGTIDIAQNVATASAVSFATGYTYSTVIWIDLNDNSTFEASEIFFNAESTNANPTTLNTTFTLPATAALGEHRMRIVATDAVQTPANPCYNGTFGVTLDFLVNVIPQPSCLPVTGLAVTADTISSSGAKITWTASDSNPANGYQYYVSTENTAPTATTTPTGTVAAGSTAAILAGLQSATTYYVWVRSICSATDNSSWSSSVTFITLCEGFDLDASVYMEGFESITANNQLPNCMTATSMGTITRTYTATPTAPTYNRTPYSGEKFAAFRYAPGTTNWFFSAPLNVVAGQTYNVSVFYITDGAAGFTAFNIGGGTAQNAAAMTVLGSVANPTNTTYQELTATFTADATGVYYVGLQATGTSFTPWYLSFDDLSVTANPLGLGNADPSKFTAYPNPVKDILNLSYGQNISDVAVFNMLGQQVKAKTLNAANGQVDMSDLPSGTYLVRVSADNQVKTLKVMKQ